MNRSNAWYGMSRCCILGCVRPLSLLVVCDVLDTATRTAQELAQSRLALGGKSIQLI